MKKLIPLVLVLAMLISLVPISAGASVVQEGGNGTVSWVLEDNGTLTISGTGTVDHVPFLSNMDHVTKIVVEKGIAAIGDGAFSQLSDVLEVILPEGLVSIGNYAFQNLYQLKSITIPTTVQSIGEGAFCYTAITLAVIPDGVKYIGASAFCSEAESLRAVVPASVETIGLNAFYSTADVSIFYAGTKEQWEAFGTEMEKYYRYHMHYNTTATDHTWVEADCVVPKHCSGCGLQEGDAPGHSYSQESMEGPQVCTRCYKAIGAKSGDLNVPSAYKLDLLFNMPVVPVTRIYEEEPSVRAPYSPGKLTEEYLMSGFTHLQYIRYVSRLPLLTLNSNMNETAQYGAVVMAANRELSHYPEKPQNMDQAFFERGYQATSRSNICCSYGYNSLGALQSHVQSYMDDLGASNLTAVGHRTHILNPQLDQVGLGLAEAENQYLYSTMYMFDSENQSILYDRDTDYDFTAWPASGNFPVELIGTNIPWSININPKRFAKPDMNKLKITLTRHSDGKVMVFDKNTGDVQGSNLRDAYARVNDNTIIFHIGTKNNVNVYDGKYTVHVSGLEDRQGNSLSFHYQVNFFSLQDPSVAEPAVGVTRLAGGNRFETAFRVADEMKQVLEVEGFESIVLASGNNFADALAGSYLANQKVAPILLSYKGKWNQKTADYIKKNLLPGGVVYILGGTEAVSQEMEDLLDGCRVKRLAGADRFETNLLILEEAGVVPGQEILVCTGKNFADSLSASASGYPILLVYKKLSDRQIRFLEGLENNSFCIIGGASAVPETLEKAISTYGATERVAGDNRLETSALVAERYYRIPFGAVTAYGWNYPDGLCGGPLAYAMNAPLLLTHSKSSLYGDTKDYVSKAGVLGGYVLGGESLVDDAAVRAIYSLNGDAPIR